MAMGQAGFGRGSDVARIQSLPDSLGRTFQQCPMGHFIQSLTRLSISVSCVLSPIPVQVTFMPLPLELRKKLLRRTAFSLSKLMTQKRWAGG